MAQTTDNGAHRSKSYLRYIPCRVEPGMFEGEWLVRLDAKDPENPKEIVHVQLFVDQREVKEIHGTPRRGKPAKGKLRVAVANKAKGYVQVVFPQPAVPVGESAFFDEKVVTQELGV